MRQQAPSRTVEDGREVFVLWSINRCFFFFGFCFSFVFWWYWVLNWGLTLARQVLYHLSYALALCFLFQGRVCIFAGQGAWTPSGGGAWTTVRDLLCRWHHCPWLIGWYGVSLIFCPGWLRTVLLLISISPVAGMTGRSHCVQKHTHL
jgi:hypothetical protein